MVGVGGTLDGRLRVTDLKHSIFAVFKIVLPRRMCPCFVGCLRNLYDMMNNPATGPFDKLSEQHPVGVLESVEGLQRLISEVLVITTRQ